MVMLRSIATVGGYTSISRVLGLVRDILIARAVGTGDVADAFFVAFRLPNMFRRIFAEGAFNAAFVPLFARRLEEEGPDAAKRFAEQSLSVLVFSLLPLLGLAMVAMPWVMLALAPGFRADPAKFDLAVDLARITFPYLLFMALAALLGGLLNSLYRFSAAAAAPILLNIFFIVALALVLPVVGHPGPVMAWTVALAGIGQFLLLVVAAARAGMPLRLPRPRLTPGVKRLLRLMAPGVASAGAMQINLVIGTIIASQQEGAVSFLYYADRIYQLPLGLIGIAFGVVLLPDLARKLRAGSIEAAGESMNRGLEMSLLLTLPATVALMVIPEPIIIVLYEHGALTREGSEAISLALIAFASGLPAFVLVKVLQTAFFAREDTRTPLIFALWTVGANVVLSLLLFTWLQHVGIALATALAAWLNLILLAVALRRRNHHSLDQRLLRRLPRIGIATILMGVVIWVLSRQIESWLDGSLGLQVIALALLVAAGLVAFFGFAFLFGAARITELRTMARRPGGHGPAAPS
jgi:putative peptidoglycan lipid II flippase